MQRVAALGVKNSHTTKSALWEPVVQSISSKGQLDQGAGLPTAAATKGKAGDFGLIVGGVEFQLVCNFIPNSSFAFGGSEEDQNY